jgi:electron transport complex protein RnfE
MADATPSPLVRFRRGFFAENAVFVQVLGMCPTLAVTNSLDGAITMGIATSFVLLCSNIVVSLLRNLLQPHVRILIFTVTIATFVTIADYTLKARFYDLSVKLGPYVPLIIVNCLIIGRAEVCASKQGLPAAVMDGLGQGIGFTGALAVLGTIRELLGAGTLLNARVLPELTRAADGTIEQIGWDPWSIMIMPAGAFITLGILMGLANWIAGRRKAA